MSAGWLAIRADEVAHVLDDAERRDIQLLVHPDRAPAVGERHLLRGRHDDRSGDGNRLTQAQRDVSGSRRHVDDEVVEVVPADFAEELLDGAVQHRPAPDHRRVVRGHETHRDDLKAVLLRRQDLLAVGRELRVDAEHDRHVGTVDVPVDDADTASALRQRDRKVDRNRRLSRRRPCRRRRR